LTAIKKSIPLTSLALGEPLAQDIYDEYDRLLLKAGTILTEQYIASLQGKGVETVFIAIALKINSEEPKEAPKEPIKNKVIPITNFTEPYKDLIYEQSRVKGRGFNVKKIHKEFSQKTREFTDLLLKDPEESLEFFLRTKSTQQEHNYEEHHVNTGILSALLAHWLGLDKQITYEIVNVAMLHDIGETRIPSEILQKPSYLSWDEMEIVRKHPSIGFEILCKTDWINNRELLGVLTHHERLNGTGYPNKLLGSQIIIHSRITAVSSIFNSSTTDRPYAKAKSLPQVLLELRNRSFGELDNRVTRVLFDKITAKLPEPIQNELKQNC